MLAKQLNQLENPSPNVSPRTNLKECWSKCSDFEKDLLNFVFMNAGSAVFNFIGSGIITYSTKHIDFQTMGDKKSVAYGFYLYFLVLRR